MTDSITAYLGRQSRPAILFLGTAVVVVVGFLDFLTGYEASISVFYLAPICLVAWYAGQSSGVAFAIVSASVWLLADVGAGHTFDHAAVPLWNAVVLLGSFIIVVVVLVRLKVAYETQLSLANELHEAMDKIKVLKGLIPICAWCKKIRDDKGYWQEVDTYITEHSEALFTHAICPQCKEKVKKELVAINKTSKQTQPRE